MFITDEEAISFEARRDMIALLKEYARIGHKQLYGDDDDEVFEGLWGEAFNERQDRNCAAEKPGATPGSSTD